MYLTPFYADSYLDARLCNKFGECLCHNAAYDGSLMSTKSFERDKALRPCIHAEIIFVILAA